MASPLIKGTGTEKMVTHAHLIPPPHLQVCSGGLHAVHIQYWEVLRRAWDKAKIGDRQMKKEELKKKKVWGGGQG